MLLPFSTELGFTLHEDTSNGRATTHQLYSFAIEIGFAPMVAQLLYYIGMKLLSQVLEN